MRTEDTIDSQARKIAISAIRSELSPTEARSRIAVLVHQAGVVDQLVSSRVPPTAERADVAGDLRAKITRRVMSGTFDLNQIATGSLCGWTRNYGAKAVLSSIRDTAGGRTWRATAPEAEPTVVAFDPERNADAHHILIDVLAHLRRGARSQVVVRTVRAEVLTITLGIPTPAKLNFAARWHAREALLQDPEAARASLRDHVAGRGRDPLTGLWADYTADDAEEILRLDDEAARLLADAATLPLGALRVRALHRLARRIRTCSHEPGWDLAASELYETFLACEVECPGTDLDDIATARDGVEAAIRLVSACRRVAEFECQPMGRTPRQIVAAVHSLITDLAPRPTTVATLAASLGDEEARHG